jgi:FkbM family methyltransferase
MLKTKSQRTLVYCGVHKCDSFGALVPHFDVCYGFEADPQLANDARARYAGDPKVHIVHAALCETNGSITLNIHDSAGATSLGQLGDAYRMATGNRIHAVRQVTVPAVNLHDYLAARQIETIDRYQSDIQGMDYAVLHTLKPMIARGAIKVICCETERDEHGFQSYDDLPSNRLACFMELLDRNYQIVEVQKVLPNWVHQDVTWALRPRHLLRWHLRRLGLMAR